jgi:DNA-binding transcriptional LysR family regulator
MTLKQLEAFYWAATLGSFSIAASRLHVTQSSLSKRIAELESDLGKPLFDRSGQRAIVTDAGQRLLDHAAQMLDIESRIRADVDTASTVRGNSRFGISELIAVTWFPHFVTRVRRAHPNLVLEPQVDLTQGLEKKLERGDLDFAVIPGPAASPNLAHEKVGELEYRWMASPERLAKGTVLTPAHFIEHPVITLSPEAGLSRAFERWAAEQNLDVPRALTCNSLTALIALAVAGVGISFFPRVYIEPYVRAGKLVELVSEPPLPNLSYYFHWRAGDTRAAVTSLRKITLEVANFSLGSPLWPDTAR